MSSIFSVWMVPITLFLDIYYCDDDMHHESMTKGNRDRQQRGIGPNTTYCLGTRWVCSIFICTYISNVTNLFYFFRYLYWNNNMHCKSHRVTKVNRAQTMSHHLSSWAFSFFFMLLILYTTWHGRQQWCKAMAHGQPWRCSLTVSPHRW